MKLKLMAGVLLLFVFYLPPLQASAHEFHGIKILDEYQLPEEFNLKVSDMCSGHSSIKQASARPDGWFAVCSLYTDTTENIDWVYSLHFVDIYDRQGQFVQEISFYTELDNAIELTNDSLNIYFQTFIVSYDLESSEYIAYSIPSRETIKNGLLFELDKSTFHSGEWEYCCTGGWNLYSKLTRSNGVITDVLVDYSSRRSFFPWHILVISCAICVLVVIGIRLHYKRKKIE